MFSSLLLLIQAGVCEALCYFATKIPVPNKQIGNYIDQIPVHQKALYLYPTNALEIKKIVQKLANKHSSG